jgi:hypothetical protein
MYWLLDSEPVEVSAFSLPMNGGDPIGENNVAANFRFADGSIGSLTYCTIGSKSSAGERVEVFAQGVGLATEDFKQLTIKAGTRAVRSRWWAEKGYRAQMESFMDGLRAGRPPLINVRDGARSTLGCLRLLESARAGGKPCAIDLEALLR